VRLSAFSVVDGRSAGGTGDLDRYREVLALAEACDAAPLSALWVAEHHFHSGGVCPAPPVLLAAAGERTRRVRLGVLVSVLPFHNPIETAEQYAMLDQLLDGRLNLGLGSGYIPLEFQGFDIDPATKRERFDRALEAIVRLFRGESLPPHGSRPDGVRLNVRPRQTPHPPIWIAVQRREALPFVARRGVSVALVPYATVGTLDELADEIREFRSHLPAGTRALVSAAAHLYAGPRPDRARAAFGRYLDSRLKTQSVFYAEKAHRDPRHASPEAIEEAGFALFGSPSEVARRLELYRRAGVDEVLGIFDFGGLPVEDVTRSVRGLGSEFAAAEAEALAAAGKEFASVP
jgi:alkanesulfonate monooxygenase SsuD/methylene tetrahydromethanopterin reductase-like flavin-dependent oxidoreductase (luciferase family)